MNNISQPSNYDISTRPCENTDKGFYSLPQIIPGINNPYVNMSSPPMTSNVPNINPQNQQNNNMNFNTSGSPSTLAGTDTNIYNPDSLQYLNGFLRTQIGRKVLVEFLVGTSTLVDRSGVLVAVGTNYILLNEFETDDIVACDYYNIKFIRFYY